MDEILIPTTNGRSTPIQGTSFVIVGANGSGKSQLGVWLEEKGIQGRATHRISAQRALLLPEFVTLLPRERAERLLYFGLDHHLAAPKNRSSHRWGGEPAGNVLNDYDALLATLWALETDRNAAFVKEAQLRASKETLEVPESPLDKLRRIWRELLPHRQLHFEAGKVMASVSRNPAQTYHGRKMGDGERVMIYLIGQALCAPQNALLIIDEPETHLHRAIRERLWDAIEAQRTDCLFVFMTHDLEFAASRESATKIWLKSFDGSAQHPAWDWEECPTGLELPAELVLQVLGSRRPVIFVEGDSVSSLDAKLYKLLFPARRIIPVGGAPNVDRYVTALRGAPFLHHLQPYGIVDRDHRLNVEINALAARGVACCPYAEVENLLVDESVLVAVAKRANVPDPNAIVAKIKQNVVGKLKCEQEVQAAQWAEAVVARKMAGFSCKETDAKKVAAAVTAHANGMNVEELYSEAKRAIESVIAEDKYAEVLRVFNQKGLVALASSVFGTKTDVYEQLALGAIRDEKPLRDHLASLTRLSDSRSLGPTERTLMSVTCSVAIVPWDEFTQAVTTGAQGNQTEDDALALAMQFEPESLRDNSQQRQDDFLEAFEAFAPQCPTSSATAFAAIFNSLFWTWRSKDHRIWDLPVPPDKLPFGPESAWSPATVKRQAAAWKAASVDELGKAFRPTDVFATFDEFKHYAQEWGDIIQRGADRNLGLVTFTWG